MCPYYLISHVIIILAFMTTKPIMGVVIYAMF